MFFSILTNRSNIFPYLTCSVVSQLIKLTQIVYRGRYNVHERRRTPGHRKWKWMNTVISVCPTIISSAFRILCRFQFLHHICILFMHPLDHYEVSSRVYIEHNLDRAYIIIVACLVYQVTMESQRAHNPFVGKGWGCRRVLDTTFTVKARIDTYRKTSMVTASLWTFFLFCVLFFSCVYFF